MKQIIITSQNYKGDDAINQHLKESKKMGWREKLIFKTAGYTQEKLTENPLTLVVTVNNRHADNPAFLSLIEGEIEKGLNLNGAKKDEDYLVEIK